jgi:hypothetical protein
VYATKFRIFENFNGGSIVKIEAINKGEYQTIYSRESPTLITEYNIFEAEIQPKPLLRYDKYKITLSCTLAENYSQIDAIQLIGTLTSSKIPKESLKDSFAILYNNQLFSDFQINFGSEVLYAHKNIIAVRCADLFDSLQKIDGRMNELSLKGFAVILSFVYTDAVDDAKIAEFVESEKTLYEKENSTGENKVLRLDSWKGCINKLVRYAMKYKMARLEAILLNYLVEKYFSVDNVLEVLVDSIKDDDDLTDKTTAIIDVQLLCADFIRKNLAAVVGSQKINDLPKNILLKILKNIV